MRPRLGRADLQIHTTAGDGMASAAETLRWAERAGLDLIAVPAHDDVRGALIALEEAGRLGSPVRVLPGVELTTRGGHLLALFPRGAEGDPVPDIRPLRALDWTIATVHAKGGICVVPHPMAWVPASVGRGALDRLAAGPDESRPDGIELATPTPAAQLRRRAARRANRVWGLSETGGSDAHFPEAIGSAVTRFPGREINDFVHALATATTAAETRRAPSLRESGARRILAQQTRGLSATPRALVARAVRSARMPRRARGETAPDGRAVAP